VAAVWTGRRYFGYETDPAYIPAAEARVEAERAPDASTRWISPAALYRGRLQRPVPSAGPSPAADPSTNLVRICSNQVT
jgi:hypothetical protein